MTNYYVDLENGNDANDGLSFANRKKTIDNASNHATAGDIVRVMSSPNESLIGNATWTQNSTTVTLASAVTTVVTNCDSAWTASANVTATVDSSIKVEGTNSSKIAIGSAFTTGLAAYFATGTLDLSGYQQLSFWVRPLSGNIATGSFSLRLCSDTAGVTTVNTLAIPTVPWTNDWVPITVDLGSNFGSSIQSIALYCDTDPGAMTVYLDHIIACKASSSADSLTLTSLIGKVWNRSWVASTTYATNDIRIPTQGNRNGYRYKVTAGGGGAAGSTEPTWPVELGLTVTDGALTWTCDSLEDTWYPLSTINGTTVKLTAKGYADTTETVATYKRETIKQVIPGGSASAVNQLTSSGGTPTSNVVFSGGWDRTAMTTQDGQTWVDNLNNQGIAFEFLSHNFIEFRNINAVRAGLGIRNCGINYFYNCHINGTGSALSYTTGQIARVYAQGFIANNSASDAISVTAADGYIELHRFRIENTPSTGSALPQRPTNLFVLKDGACRNNANSSYFNTSMCPGIIDNVVFSSTGSNVSIGDVNYNTVFTNCLFSDSVAFTAPPKWEQYVYSQKHNQTAGNHLVTTLGGTIVSDTAQRHTASGISWKFKPTNVGRNSARALTLSVAKVACAANVSVNAKIWCYRDNTNINGLFIVKGGQILGVPNDVSVACAPTINTWTQSSTLTFTPTEAGVVEISFQVYDSTGTTNSFWIDDISFS